MSCFGVMGQERMLPSDFVYCCIFCLFLKSFLFCFLIIEWIEIEIYHCNKQTYSKKLHILFYIFNFTFYIFTLHLHATIFSTFGIYENALFFKLNENLGIKIINLLWKTQAGKVPAWIIQYFLYFADFTRPSSFRSSINQLQCFRSGISWSTQC